MFYMFIYVEKFLQLVVETEIIYIANHAQPTRRVFVVNKKADPVDPPNIPDFSRTFPPTMMCLPYKISSGKFIP